MSGRLAVDFGTSNTVVAAWDAARQEARSLFIPDFGRTFQQGEEQVAVIPSLIHYESEQRRWVGNQVLQRDLYRSNRTLRWLKRYIINRSPVQMRFDGRQIAYPQAGQDFLSSVLLFAAAELDLGDEEVALSVPVESFEHYENWLAGVAAASNLPRFRLIDEPSAAALGYGAHIQPGDVYLIFDFGGGTLDVAAVLIEPEESGLAGRRCRVLGKAGSDLGGATIDQWLYQSVLRQNNRRDSDEEVRRVSAALLVECERVKEELTFNERSSLHVTDPVSGLELHAEFTPGQFEALLDEHDAFTILDRTLRRALSAARERGYLEEDVKAVLMVGGSSQIPPVQRAVRRIFGRERVLLHRPLDAIARGAAAFVAGVDFYDHIQHDYAIRFWNSARGEYDYRTIVGRGTPYPTPEAVARLTVKAANEVQSQLGIQIYEIGEGARTPAAGPLELVFDPSGAARMTALTPVETEQRTRFWMNEANPTFLPAEPPAQEGEARFEVSFAVDGNKRLLITARDLKTGVFTHRNYPVVKLS